MPSKVKLLGHPVHPMLVVFPLGLFAVVIDILYIYITSGNIAFPTVSYYMIAAGLLGGLLAGVFGAIDWFGLPYNSRAWNMGLSRRT